MKLYYKGQAEAFQIYIHIYLKSLIQITKTWDLLFMERLTCPSMGTWKLANFLAVVSFCDCEDSKEHSKDA